MCFKLIQNLYNYICLIKNIRNYYNNVINNSYYDDTLLSNIINRINNCGAVTIKFCQWLLPKIEMIHIKNQKPQWFIKLEKFYEECPTHSEEYTKIIFNKEFNESFDENYKIKRIIGSGSMGQVYHVDNIINNTEEVIKVLHPNIEENIDFFKKVISFLLWFPITRKKINRLFPFNIYKFIDDFYIQSDLVNEANNLIQFSRKYKNNDYIIIPEVLKISKNILIMTYEKGESFYKSDINEYQKEKLITIFNIFVRSNQILFNLNHGDLHPGNWKIREENNIYKLIYYDFGYCWSIENKIFIDMGPLFWETFENSTKENVDDTINNLCKIMYYIILYDDKDKDNNFKLKIREHINKNIEKLKPWNISPFELLQCTIDFCIQESLLINPTLIQGFIMQMQLQKLFEDYNLQSSEENDICDYEVFRERYLNILTLCKTLHIFPEYTKYIENKLNKKNVIVESLFDTINIGDNIKNLIKFDN